MTGTNKVLEWLNISNREIDSISIRCPPTYRCEISYSDISTGNLLLRCTFQLETRLSPNFWYGAQTSDTQDKYFFKETCKFCSGFYATEVKHSYVDPDNCQSGWLGFGLKEFYCNRCLGALILTRPFSTDGRDTAFLGNAASTNCVHIAVNTLYPTLAVLASNWLRFRAVRIFLCTLVFNKKVALIGQTWTLILNGTPLVSVSFVSRALLLTLKFEWYCFVGRVCVWYSWKLWLASTNITAYPWNRLLKWF